MLPPTFLLPCRTRYISSTPQHVESPIQEPISSQLSAQNSTASLEPGRPSIVKSEQPSVTETVATPLTPSVRELLPLLAAQPSHFVTTHIHARPYLVTAGDIVRLPFQMPGVVPGDVLRLNRASAIGSRDYTLKGAPYVDERLYECRAIIMGTESEPLRKKTKTKRRNRKVKTVQSKLRFTIMRISELKINRLEDIEG